MARTKKKRGGFVFGAVVGAVAGLLLAPKSGRETREQLFGEGGLGAQVDRIRDAIGAGRSSAADQSEALRLKIEETLLFLRDPLGQKDKRVVPSYPPRLVRVASDARR